MLKTLLPFTRSRRIRTGVRRLPRSSFRSHPAETRAQSGRRWARAHFTRAVWSPGGSNCSEPENLRRPPAFRAGPRPEPRQLSWPRSTSSSTANFAPASRPPSKSPSRSRNASANTARGRKSLTQNGPYDEPTLTYAQGYVFAQGDLIRQAAQAFRRVRTLSTNDLGSRLWLAQLHLNQQPARPDAGPDPRNSRAAQRVTGAVTNLTDLFTLGGLSLLCQEANRPPPPEAHRGHLAQRRQYSVAGRRVRTLRRPRRLHQRPGPHPAHPPAAPSIPTPCWSTGLLPGRS